MTILYDTQTAKLGPRFNPSYIVDGKPGQLPDYIIELAIVEAPRPVTAQNEAATSEWTIDTDQREYRQEWTIRQLSKEEMAPTVITKAQGLIMLEQMGLFDRLMTTVEGMTKIEKIVFEATKEWEIDNALIGKMQVAFSMSDDEKYDFFIAASQIVI